MWHGHPKLSSTTTPMSIAFWARCSITLESSIVRSASTIWSIQLIFPSSKFATAAQSTSSGTCFVQRACWIGRRTCRTWTLPTFANLSLPVQLLMLLLVFRLFLGAMISHVFVAVLFFYSRLGFFRPSPTSDCLADTRDWPQLPCEVCLADRILFLIMWQIGLLLY